MPRQQTKSKPKPMPNPPSDDPPTETKVETDNETDQTYTETGFSNNSETQIQWLDTLSMECLMETNDQPDASISSSVRTEEPSTRTAHSPKEDDSSRDNLLQDVIERETTDRELCNNGSNVISSTVNNQPGTSPDNQVPISSSTSTVTISEDSSHHDHYCFYYRWDVSFRRSLMTDAQAREILTEINVKKSTNEKFQPGAVVDPEIKTQVDSLLSKGFVRNYLDGTREIYDSFKDAMKARCHCLTARKTAKSPPTSPRKPNTSWSFQDVGLDLSEDESDSEDVNEKATTAEEKEFSKEILENEAIDFTRSESYTLNLSEDEDDACNYIRISKLGNGKETTHNLSMDETSDVKETTEIISHAVPSPCSSHHILDANRKTSKPPSPAHLATSSCYSCPTIDTSVNAPTPRPPMIEIEDEELDYEDDMETESLILV